MKAMILAAGLGTRLKSYTTHLPKPLLPVGERPLIYYNLLLLKRYGITEVVINLHYKAEKLKAALETDFADDMHIVFSEEPELLGTGGGVKKVAHFFEDRSFIVMNGDILVDLNLDKVVEYHLRKKATATMVLREDPEADQWGALETDAQGRIHRLRGCGDGSTARLFKYMFTGVHVLEPRVLDYVPPGCFYSITDAYVEMIKKGEKIFGHVSKGFWSDLGTPQRYQQAKADMESGRLKLSYLR